MAKTAAFATAGISPMTFLIRMLLQLAVVLTLGSLCLYVARAIYESYRKQDIPRVIRPLAASGVDDADKRGITLAHLLSGRLGEIGKQMRAAEVSWREAQNIAPQRVAIPGHEATIKPIQLPHDVFRPLDLNMSVANVEVGKLISWLHGWLAADRDLSLSVVYTGDKAVVSGDLNNQDGDSLWIETNGKNDVEMISEVAYAIAQKPYARQYPETEYLEPHDFGELLGSLNRIAMLNRKAPHTGVAPAEYLAEYNRLEPLMQQHLPKWPTLVDLVGNLAERCDKLDDALRLYKQELLLFDAKKDADTIRELQKRITAITARLAATKPPVTAVLSQTEATAKVRAFMNVPTTLGPVRRRARIGIVGPPPAKGVLPDTVPVTLVNEGAVANEEPDPLLTDYNGRLSQSVQMVFPDVEFVFSQMKSRGGSMFDSEILQSLDALLDSGKAIDIILYTYGSPIPRGPISSPVLKNLIRSKVLFVFAAGNEGQNSTRAMEIFPKDSPFRPGGELRKYIAVAAAVDLTGKATPFTQQDSEVLWAPGTEIFDWQGTSLAAALTAGAAACLKAYHPNLEPSEIVRILQGTSVPKMDPKVKVIDVAAALAKATASAP